MLPKIIKKMVKGFPVLIHPDESGGFWVECSKLRGCYSQGETIEEAAKNMQEAIELHLGVLQEENQSFSKSLNSYLKPSIA